MDTVSDPIVASTHTRYGVVLAPDGSDREREGVLNPGITRDRNGRLLMFPRMVAAGNVSCIGIARGIENGNDVSFERLGVVLSPETPFEMREGGHGCEDPRVTFVPRLNSYVMAYAAFGDDGPRVAVAVSDDAYCWTRLGLLTFADDALNRCDNKDAAFFPEPVLSPAGELSFALYHRPMLPDSVNGQTPISVMLSLDPEQRESMALAYVPVAAVERDIGNLRHTTESVKILGVDKAWGWLKNGAGTPPVHTPAGWLSFYHGVDAVERAGNLSLYYRAGVVMHDLQRPDRISYRSPEPLLGPVTVEERFGTVPDVVFPTGIDVRAHGEYDVYYGAADAKIAMTRFHFTFA